MCLLEMRVGQKPSDEDDQFVFLVRLVFLDYLQKPKHQKEILHSEHNKVGLK